MTPMKTVSTSKGEVKLFPPTVELLESIRSFLPFGIARYTSTYQGADFGLVIKRGEDELFAVKQQPIDYDEAQSNITRQANAILVAESLQSYLSHGFSGLFMPFAYRRTKDAGRFETGIAYFGAPSKQGRECLEYPFDAAYDRQFGHGFTTMMGTFIRALQQSSRDTGISLDRIIGLDVRSLLQLGSFSFGYMLVGPHVICLKTEVSERDPTWTILRSTGISEVFHIPSMAAVLKSSASTN
ncbi:MAG: hypothetical protein HZB31_01535 [Nitrospirae bacterium]|nr:hypothetical protein [Nitrospirota bacterium]